MALLFGKDRRLNKRQPVRVMAASLNTLENRSLGNCVIRDISPDGARLELNEKRTLPQFIYIFDVREQRQKCAQVVRQHAKNVGIRFVDAPVKSTAPIQSPRPVLAGAMTLIEKQPQWLSRSE